MSYPPLIGITLCIDRGKKVRPGRDYYYVARDYSRQVALAGAEPVLLGVDSPSSVLARLDALVVTGGDDLPIRFEDPRRLGESVVHSSRPSAGTPSDSSSPEDTDRIVWERQLLDEALRLELPVLGICYGMQIINLHLGGTLHDSLARTCPEASDHGGNGRGVDQQVVREPSSDWLSQLPDAFGVRCSHGQAVDAVAPGMLVTAQAADGVIEAIETPAGVGPQWCGVEWHPEIDETGPALFDALFVHAKHRAEGSPQNAHSR